MLDVEKLYTDYKIPYVTTNHRHARDGWVNIECPFCTGNKGYHLGFNIQGQFFTCWRCGGHGVNWTLSKVLGVSFREVKEIIKRYGGGSLIQIVTTKKPKLPFSLPSPLLGDFGEIHTKYLENRGFDPAEIKDKWNVSASGLYSRLDNLDFKWRLIIPIYWNNEIVNFQARDVTEKARNKYLACSENREKLNIKETLYGNPKAWGDVAICVEGIFDVWRMGDMGVGLYGVKYKPIQVRLLTQFKRVFVIFDADKAGQQQAMKLVAELNFRGVDAYNYKLPDGLDPADLTDEQAKNIINTLKTWKIK